MVNLMKTNIPNLTRPMGHLPMNDLKNAGIILLAVATVSCATFNQKKQADQRLTMADGIQQVCEKANLLACSEMRMSYQHFAINDPGTARKHVRQMLEQNDGGDVDALSSTLDAAGRISGDQGHTVQQYAQFLHSVVRGESSALQSTTDPNPIQDELIQMGCMFDSQCKFDRVCINGECISARYRESVEAQYMASSKGIIMPDAEKKGGDDDIELELLYSDTGEAKMLCKPERITRCMKKCEKGDAPHCYAVGKLYQQLPISKQHNDFMLFAYDKACSSGLMDACIDLGNLHFYGRFGLRNMELAYQFNLNACEQGNGIGCVNTARLLKSGKGVAQDAERADNYYNRACQLGQSQYCVGGVSPADSDIVFTSPELPEQTPDAVTPQPEPSVAVPTDSIR